MISNLFSYPFTFCALLFISSFAQIVIGNGSCQLYGHSCLGGHGKRSTSNDGGMDGSAPSRVNDRLLSSSSSGQSPSSELSIAAANAGLTDAFESNEGVDSALPLDVQEKLALKERLDLLSNNLGRQLKRIQQYRTLKRMEPLLALLAPEEMRKRTSTLAELKKRRDYLIDADSINQLL